MKKHFTNLAILGLVVTGIMIGTNKLISVVSEMNDHLPIGKGKFFHWKYGDIYYTKEGSGAPVLLIHDLRISSSSYEWTRIVEKISRTNTVYTIDLLGCGRSDKPNITYSNFLYVQLINDFIKHVIEEPVDVIVTGYSTPLVVMACQMEPDNFRKIIGVSPCDLYDLLRTPGKRKNILKFMIEMPVLGTFIYNIETTRFHITDKMTTEYFHKPHLVSKEIIDNYCKAARKKDGKGKYLLASIRAHYTNINIMPALKKINHDICLIGGKEHPYMSDIISEYQENNAAIESAYISNTTYLPQLEAPDKFVNLINILINA